MEFSDESPRPRANVGFEGTQPLLEIRLDRGRTKNVRSCFDCPFFSFTHSTLHRQDIGILLILIRFLLAAEQLEIRARSKKGIDCFDAYGEANAKCLR